MSDKPIIVTFASGRTQVIEPVVRGKHGPRVREPGIVRKAVSLCSSIRRWVTAGKPVRTQEQVNELLAICLECPLLLDAGTGRQRCGKCGCPVSGRIENPKANKLAMATERCPLDPPKWTADIQPK